MYFVNYPFVSNVIDQVVKKDALCSDINAGENERRMRGREGRGATFDARSSRVPPGLLYPPNHFHQHRNARSLYPGPDEWPEHAHSYSLVCSHPATREKKEKNPGVFLPLLSRHVQRCFSFTYSSRYLRDTRGSDLNDEADLKLRDYRHARLRIDARSNYISARSAC